MAGDWIKVETTLPDKPEVGLIAKELCIDQDSVVGKLVRLWIWADANTTNGNAVSVTSAHIDRIVACVGFTEALKKVTWLGGCDGNYHFPNFERHNGQTAKARGLTYQRVTSHRLRKCNARTVTKSLPETETEIEYPPIVPQGTLFEDGQKPRTGRPKKKPEVQPPDYSEDFLRFWKTYPRIRLTKKRKAWEAWQRAVKRAAPTVILEAVAEFAVSPLGGSRFCPGPEPWLNQDRWEDDRMAWQRSGEEPMGPHEPVEEPYKEF